MVVMYNILGRQVGSHYVSSPHIPYSQTTLAVAFERHYRLSLNVRLLTEGMLYKQLALATLGTTFLGAYVAMSGGDKKKKETGPPINATSKDEEKFIQYVAHVSILQKLRTLQSC